MRKFRGFVKRKFQPEEGQSMVEYGLIIALIALVVIAGLMLIGTHLSGLFNHPQNTLNNSVTSASSGP
ncbi:MAG: Flp family type IVb pilin [Alicyclobacillus sp.]|nr:Flp family type IVb pilin [Alicyclobacillus sp.]